MISGPRLRGGSDAAWTVAILVILVCLISTFTLSRSGSSPTAASGSNASAQDNSNNGAGGTDTSSAPGGAESNGTGGNQGGTAGGHSRITIVGGGGSVNGTAGSAGGNAGSRIPGSAGTSGGGAGASGGTAGSGGTASGPGQPTVSADCAKNQNAGASDQGITGNSINMAATVVRSGIAKSFLQDAQVGMQAVINEVRQHPICGRILSVHEDDDGWDPGRGETLIQQYISCGCYFGLAVNPSSEGVKDVINGHLLDQNQFPLIGSDGMLIDQYQDPWVWPVATSTHSVMHIIADEAHARGAKNFGIVWESGYRFGVEGHDAFVGEVGRLSGATLVEDKQITSDTSGQASYKNEAGDFVNSCSNSNSDLQKCDFIAVLLEPATATQWVHDGGLGDGSQHTKYGVGAPQPLFVSSFANDCGAPCNGLRVWTSFAPPIPPFDSQQAVATYRNAVYNAQSNVDYDNPEVEGAYQGMLLLTQALQQMGAAPTRVGIQKVLDQMTLDTGLTSAQRFQSGNHFAAISAQAFDAVYNNGSNFTGWRDARKGYLTDNEVNQDISAN